MIAINEGLFGYRHDSIVAGPLDMEFGKAEVVAIVGRSGCGKSTILKAIAGEIALLQGDMRLDGAIRDREWRRQNIVRTIQSFPLLHWHTVEDNLRLAAQLRGISSISVSDLLAEFSAQHLRVRYPGTLSGGERCRASLAQAALTRPKILLLDEPFTGLDLQVKEDIAQRLFSYAKSHNTTILFVTHDVHDACEYAKRIIVLKSNDVSPTTIQEIVKSDQGDSLSKVRRLILRQKETQ